MLASLYEQISGEDLYQWRQWAIQLAQANNVEASEVDWLLQGLTSIKSLPLRLDSYRKEHSILCYASLTQLNAKWRDRIENKVPVQYLVGEVPWRNFSLTVSTDVLIPRPETELIIDLAENLAGRIPMAVRSDGGNWADLGTGSGAIALGLAHTFSEATIYAVDISEQALDIARQNAENNSLDHHITFYQGRWLSPLSFLKGQLTGVVSNPPYIPSQTVLTLQPEVANHEPHLALDGGPNGLSCLKTLIIDGSDYLQPGGLWLTELMDGQAKIVTSLLKDQGSYTHIAIHQDLSGIDRFVSAYKAL